MYSKESKFVRKLQRAYSCLFLHFHRIEANLLGTCRNKTWIVVHLNIISVSKWDTRAFKEIENRGSIMMWDTG